MSGVRKRVVSKKVVLADVPPVPNVLFRTPSLQSPLAEESYNCWYSRTPQKRERGHIRQNNPFYNILPFYKTLDHRTQVFLEYTGTYAKKAHTSRQHENFQIAQFSFFRLPSSHVCDLLACWQPSSNLSAHILDLVSLQLEGQHPKQAGGTVANLQIQKESDLTRAHSCTLRSSISYLNMSMATVGPAILQKCVRDFCCIVLWRILAGIFLEDFSVHYLPRNEEKKLAARTAK